MEWFELLKMIPKAGESYSPQQVKQMLDAHTQSIILLTKTLMWICVIFVVGIIGLAANNEWDHWKLKKRIKKIEKTLDKQPMKD